MVKTVHIRSKIMLEQIQEKSWCVQKDLKQTSAYILLRAFKNLFCSILTGGEKKRSQNLLHIQGFSSPRAKTQQLKRQRSQWGSDIIYHQNKEIHHVCNKFCLLSYYVPYVAFVTLTLKAKAEVNHFLRQHKKPTNIKLTFSRIPKVL